MAIANSLFAERHQVVSGFVPVDLATGANDGDWVSFKNYGVCTVIFFAEAGIADDDPTLTFEQATAVAGTGAKALASIDTIHSKQGADLTAVGVNTVVEQTAAATYTDATSGEEIKIWQIDVRAEDLDVAGGFDCMRARVADVGTAGQFGCLLYIMGEPRYGESVLLSAIVD